MPRLTREEIAHHHARLSCWRTPAEMASFVSELNDAMGSTDFFLQGGVQFLRDAWLAAEFGRHRRSDLVRLVPEAERWPDFYARVDGRDVGVECIEASLPGRRRGDEYREAEEKANARGIYFADHPLDESIDQVAQIRDALTNAVAAKISKQYSSRPSLLIYLNIGEYGIHQAEVEASMAPSVRAAVQRFDGVWILWKSCLYGPL